MKRTRRGRINFWNFKRARNFVRKLKLKNQKEWKKYCISGLKPNEIPANPWCYYRSQWIDNFDWIGRKKERYWSNRKYNVNHGFFKKWSSDMAYVLGLWFADGWISLFKKQKIFAIGINQKDRDLLKNVLIKMESDYPIYYRNKNHLSYFHIQSGEIIKNIMERGGVERKSLCVKFPRIPKKYLPDFIRGYFDGDGSISYCKANDRYSSNFTSGSYDFICGLRDKIKNSVKKINCSINKYRPRKFTIRGEKCVGKNSYYLLTFGFKDTILLGRYIYNNGGIKMKRKYEKYLDASKLREKYVENKRVR